MSDSLLNFDSPFYLIFYWPGIFFVSAVLIGLVFVYLRSRRWRRGRDTPHHGGLRKIPRRYLVDVHDVVARDRQAAIMHVPAAGGFILALVLIVVVHVLGIATNLSRYFLLAALAVLAIGALLVLWRRMPNRSARLSGGAWGRLPVALLAFAVVYASINVANLVPSWTVDTGPFLFGIGVTIWVLFELVAFAAYGPMRHAIAGALHLAWHPRQAASPVVRRMRRSSLLT